MTTRDVSISEHAGTPPQAFGTGVGGARSRGLLLFVFGAVIGAMAMWLTLRFEPATTVQHATTAQPGEAAPKPLYRCPMHPAITADHPGECPICGMELVLVPSAEAHDAGVALAPAHTITFYRSPMDPRQTSPVPRKDEMGMDYLPVYADEITGEQASVEGRATVIIDPARQQMIGLRVAPVARGQVGGAFRTVGRVEVDPTRVRKTNVKVDGYVERIFVNFLGQAVKKGEPLFTLYSPTLLVTQNEYVMALHNKSATGLDSTLLAAARRKLELWDVPAETIDALERTGPTKTLTFVSPTSGVVTGKDIVEGSYLEPGSTPYEITDLSVVWVMVDAYGSDLARVRLGMEATLSLPAYPGRLFSGRVKFIDPLLDPNTRTVKVHLHFANPTGELKPALYGDVVMRAETHVGLNIPLDAVIHSGTRSVVFVAEEQGKFRPVEVRLGERSADQIEVLSGLVEGQAVVTRANFLVDSESQLRSSLADLVGR